MIPADERTELAARYLAEARQRDVGQLPPTLLMRECAELRRLLGQVLGILAERHDGARHKGDSQRSIGLPAGSCRDPWLPSTDKEEVGGSSPPSPLK
jgi:hypothetical protein